MLKAGTIETLYTNNRDSPLYNNPLVQILSLKKIEGKNDKTVRYHVTISDGKFYMKGILSSQVSKDIADVQVNTIIKMSDFVILEKNGTCFVYVKKCEKIKREERIGSPKSISSERENSLDPESSKSKIENQESTNPNQKIEDPPKRVQLSRKEETEDEQKSITPISALNPFQTKWFIKGTVQRKSEMRDFKNKEGKFFSFELVDQSGSIKLVAFNEAAQVFFEMVSDSAVLEVSKATVKMTNKKFNNCSSDYEIHLEKHSFLQLVNEKGIEMKFNFMKISDIQSAPEKNKCDVIGVVHEAYNQIFVVSKQTQKEIKKRDIVITDQTGNIRLTLWGEKADLEIEDNPVILISDARVSEYNNTITLNVSFTSTIKLDPEIEEAYTLRGWYDENKSDIKVERVQRSEQYSLLEQVTNFGTCLVTLLHLREDNLFYTSCIDENCNKKVHLTDEGYHCERCNQTRSDCSFKYLTTFTISDSTQQAWLQVFNDVCAAFFGMSADELKKMGEENPDELKTFLKSFLYKDYVIKLKRSEEVYNGEMKVRCRGISIKKVNYLEECKRMIKLLNI